MLPLTDWYEMKIFEPLSEISLRVKCAVILLLYSLGNYGLRILTLLLFRSIPNEPQNVLIFRNGNLGDTICALPAINAIMKRYSGKNICVLTAERQGKLPFLKEVLSELLEFKNVMVYDKKMKNVFGMVRSLRRMRYDLAVYLGQYPSQPRTLIRDMLFFKMIGCKSVCGFKWSHHRLFRAVQKQYGNFEDEVTRLMNNVSCLGIDARQVSWNIPIGQLSPELDRIMRDYPMVVALHMTTKFTSKMWPLERYFEVAEKIKIRYDPFFLIIGSDEISEAGYPLIENLGPKVLNLIGKTSLIQLAQILRCTKLLISVDSGPIHLAAAVGANVVGVYSSRDYPNCWYPFGGNKRIARRDVPCAICLKVNCIENKCVLLISSDEVYEMCVDILENGNR